MIQNKFDVPYSNLKFEALSIKGELMGSVEKVLESGRYILGPEVTGFENEFADYCQAKMAIGVSTGTSALHLTFRAFGLKEGDEVITAPNSFLASASSIALAGGRPVFADIGPDGNLDPNRVEDAMTPKTKIILPVHLTGRPARMREILDIAKRKNLKVIEDSAQAVGAKLDGRPVGSWGDAACFSLHPLKNLHAFGDGGIITTSHPQISDHLKLARNHGLVNREQCNFWSFNCRLDEIQAAMLRIQLRHLEKWTETRRQLAFRYNNLLRPYVGVPDEGSGEYCVYQTYVIQAQRRDELQRHLRQNGVEALVHYATPIHLQPAALSLGYGSGDFPMTLKHVSHILSLPLYPDMTYSQQDRVAELIAKFYKK